MKKMLITGILLSIIVLLTIYFFTGYYGYKKKDGVVYYRYLDFAAFFFFPTKKEVKGADYETFVDLKKASLGKDKNFVYYCGKPFDSIDIATFEYIKGDYAKDYNQVYCLKDGSIKQLDADVKTFVVLEEIVGKDAYNVYQQINQKIEVSDAASFEFIVNKRHNRWAKDKYSYYCYYSGRFEKAKDIDYDTFKPLKYGYAKDKNKVYYFSGHFYSNSKDRLQKTVSGANPATFKVLNNKSTLWKGIGTDGTKYFIEAEEVPKEQVDKINKYWLDRIFDSF